MRVCLEKNKLSKILTHQGLIGRRTTMPILSHVLVEAKISEEDPQSQVLSLRGTDLEMSLEEEMEAKVDAPGQVVVCCQLLCEIVRKVDDAYVTLEKGGDNLLTVRAGAAEFQLPTLKVEDFPTVPSHEWSCGFSMAAQSFLKAIQSTCFCMSTEETRYTALGGTYLNFYVDDDESISCRAVATDAYRLGIHCLRHLDVSSFGGNQIPNVVVGRRTIQGMIKLLENVLPKDIMRLGLSPHQISLEGQGFLFTSRLLEGRFPDYMRAFPASAGYQAVVDPRVLHKSIERVGVFSEERNRSIRMEFQDQMVALSAKNEQGFGRDTLSLSYKGPPLCLVFNARYLADICQHIKGAMVLEIKDAKSPVLFRSQDDETTKYVLMPVAFAEPVATAA